MSLLRRFRRRLHTLPGKFALWIAAGATAAIGFGFYASFTCSVRQELAYGSGIEAQQKSVHEATGPKYSFDKEETIANEIARLRAVVGQIEDNQQQQYRRETYSQPEPETSLCKFKIPDIGLLFLTYCLAVVGYFTMRSAEGTVRALERPWLFIENIRTAAFLDQRDGVAPRLHVFFQNPGRTHARLMSFTGKVFTTTKLTEAVVDAIPLSPAPLDSAFAITIPANSKEIEAGIDINPISQALIQEIQEGGQILATVGVFRYLGPLGDKYETAFCAQYDLRKQIWIGYGGTKYNFST
jgi:hypothetical protein